MATGYLHSLFESFPGNETNAPVASTKVIYEPLREFTPQLNPSHLDRDDELRGVDEPIALLEEAHAPAWALDTRLYPDLAGFELKAMLGAPVTTAGNGVITDPDAVVIPVGATRHVWTAPFGPAGVSPMTTQRQASYKDEGFALKLKGCATAELAIDSPESGGVGLKASGPAAYMERIAEPGLTPTYESLTIAPFERSHLTIQSFLASSATFEDFGIGASAPVEMVRSLGIASRFPDVVEKGNDPIVFTGSVPKRHIDPDDYDALKAATGFAVKARWQSTVVIGATAYKYTLWIECLNAQYTAGGPAPLTNARRLGATFDFKSTYAGVAGSTKITLVNATTSYS